MGSAQLTETVLLHLKEGIDLEQLGGDSPEVKVFIDLTDVIKGQNGCLRQYWVCNLWYPMY